MSGLNDFHAVRTALLLLLAAGSGLVHAQDDAAEVPAPAEQGCTFRADPSRFLNAQSRGRDAIHRRVKDFASARVAGAEAPPQAVPARRNFIDDEIFGKLERLNVPSAALSS